MVKALSHISCFLESEAGPAVVECAGMTVFLAVPGMVVITSSAKSTSSTVEYVRSIMVYRPSVPAGVAEVRNA